MGWLRCVGLISVVFWFRAGVMCLTLGVILYIIIIYYIIIHILLYTIIYYTLLLLYIISYTILFSSSDLFLSFPTLLSLPFQSSSDLFLSSSSSPLLLFLPFPIFLSSSVLFSHSSHSSSLSPLPIPGIPVGTYLCLFILQSHLQDILTPHVLSEWMVEVCAGD